ncbi:MAG: 16S rRNA (uracil(1498)-N(3))-methyltransferase [Spirochaetales bacterium]|nr:16S rRNA (uracil(1498)-N(3))-methyltransferase [Spirochaetales bacterium]
MKQFVLKFECEQPKGTFSLTRREYNYLINVRRMQKGDKIKALDQKNQELALEILSIDDQEALCSWEIIKKEIVQPEIEKIMIFSLLKGKKNEQVIRQAVETGVTKIIPVVSRYSISQPERKDLEKKQEKWETVITEAVQQSGRPDIPTIEAIIPIEKIKDFLNFDHTALFFHQEKLEEIPISSKITAGRPTVFAIGPEGGFSEDEIEMFLNLGFIPTFLQTPVMRAETAAVAASIMITTIASETKSGK